MALQLSPRVRQLLEEDDPLPSAYGDASDDPGYTGGGQPATAPAAPAAGTTPPQPPGAAPPLGEDPEVQRAIGMMQGQSSYNDPTAGGTQQQPLPPQQPPTVPKLPTPPAPDRAPVMVPVWGSDGGVVGYRAADTPRDEQVSGLPQGVAPEQPSRPSPAPKPPTGWTNLAPFQDSQEQPAAPPTNAARGRSRYLPTEQEAEAGMDAALRVVAAPFLAARAAGFRLPGTPEIPEGQKPSGVLDAAGRAAGAMASGALEGLGAANDYLAGRFDVIATPINAQDAILNEMYDAETVRWVKQMGVLIHNEEVVARKLGAVKGTAAYEAAMAPYRVDPESRARFDQIMAPVYARYEAIKDNPDELNRVASKAPTSTQIVSGGLSAGLSIGVGNAAAKGAGAVARGAGASSRAAKAAEYGADFLAQSAVDPTNLPMQPVGEAVLRPAAGLLGEAAKGVGWALGKLRGGQAIRSVTGDVIEAGTPDGEYIVGLVDELQGLQRQYDATGDNYARERIKARAEEILADIRSRVNLADEGAQAAPPPRPGEAVDAPYSRVDPETYPERAPNVPEQPALAPPPRALPEPAAPPEPRMLTDGGPSPAPINIAPSPTPEAYGPVAPERFIELRNRSSRGSFLSKIAPEDLADRRIYVRGSEETGWTGFALDPDGDIQNVFSVPGATGAKLAGGGVESILTAVEQGGRTLDAFDGFLPNYYHQFGFEEVGRLPFNDDYAPEGWDYARLGRPDVVLMARRDFLPGDTPDGIRARIAAKQGWSVPERAPTYGSWDDAAAARSGYLAGADGGGAAGVGPGRPGQGLEVGAPERGVDPGSGAGGGLPGGSAGAPNYAASVAGGGVGGAAGLESDDDPETRFQRGLIGLGTGAVLAGGVRRAKAPQIAAPGREMELVDAPARRVIGRAPWKKPAANAGVVVPEEATRHISEAVDRIRSGRSTEAQDALDRLVVSAHDKQQQASQILDALPPGATTAQKNKAVKDAGAVLTKAEDRALLGFHGPDELVRIFDEAGVVPAEAMLATIGDFPGYLRGMVDYLGKMRQKLVAGQLTTWDVGKAYALTVGSMQASAMSRSRLAEKGFEVEDLFVDQNKVRPEEMVAAWFGTPMGQRAKAALKRGEIDREAWSDLLDKRGGYGNNTLVNNSVFGPTERETREIGWDAPVKYGKDGEAARYDFRNLEELTNALNEAGGDPKEISRIVKKMSGIGAAKVGFIQALLGLGTDPTFDAVEINAWIAGRGNTSALTGNLADLARAAKLFTDDKKVTGALFGQIDKRFDELQRLGLVPADVPPDMVKYLIHHMIWDKFKGLETTHAGMAHAMLNYGTLGVSPGVRGGSRLSQISTDIGNFLGGGIMGAFLDAAYNPAYTDEQGNYHPAGTGWGALAGMVGGPTLGRLARGRGGALGTLGFGPGPASSAAAKEAARANIGDVAKRVMETYDRVGAQRAEATTRRAIQIASDAIAGMMPRTGGLASSPAELMTRVHGSLMRNLEGAKTVMTGLRAGAVEAYLRGEGLTSKAATRDLAKINEITQGQVNVAGGRAKIIDGKLQTVPYSLEDAADFAQREHEQFRALTGGSRFPDPETGAIDEAAPNILYAYVGDGQPLVGPNRPMFWLAWDDQTPRVTSVNHPFGLMSPAQDIHQNMAPGNKALVWAPEAVRGGHVAPSVMEGGRLVEAARAGEGTAPLVMGWEDGGIDIGDGRKIADTDYMVGPDHESEMRAAALLTGMTKGIQAQIAKGELTDPDQIAALLMRGAAPKWGSGWGAVTNPTRTESLILDPNIGNVKAIYITGSPKDLQARVAGRGSPRVIDVVKKMRADIAAQHDKDVPILFNDISVKASPRAGLVGQDVATPISQAKVLAGPPLDLAPGRQGIIDTYTSMTDPATGKPYQNLGGFAAGGAAGAGAGYESDEDPETRRERALAGLGIGAVLGGAKRVSGAAGKAKAFAPNAARVAAEASAGPRLGSKLNKPLEAPASSIPARVMLSQRLTDDKAVARWAEDLMAREIGLEKVPEGDMARPSAQARLNPDPASLQRIEDELTPVVEEASADGLLDEVTELLTLAHLRDAMEHARTLAYQGAESTGQQRVAKLTPKQQAILDRAEEQVAEVEASLAEAEAAHAQRMGTRAETGEGRAAAAEAEAEDRAQRATSRYKKDTDKGLAEAERIANAGVGRAESIRAGASKAASEADQRMEATRAAAEARVERIREDAARRAGILETRMGDPELDADEAADRAVRAINKGNPELTWESVNERLAGQIDRLDASGKGQRVLDLAQRVWDHNAKSLDAAVDAGIITPEQRAYIQENFPHYVPTVPLSKLEPGGAVRGSQAGYESVDAIAGEDTLNPLIASRNATISIGRAAQKNRVFNAMVDLIDAVRASGSDMVDASTGTRPRLLGGEVEVTGVRDGERTTVRLPQPVAEMIEYSAGAPSPGVAISFWKKIAGMVTSAITSRRPAFFAVNALRDFGDYATKAAAELGGPQKMPEVVGLYLDELSKGIADVARSYSPLKAGVGAGLGAAYGAATTPSDESNAGAATRVGLDALAGGLYAGLLGRRVNHTGTARKIIEQGGGMGRAATTWKEGQKWLAEASQVGGVLPRSPEEARRALIQIARDALTFEPLVQMGNRMEMVPRAARYRSAIKAGEGAGTATLRARDATVDFERGGEIAKQWNGLVPFLNVSIQGGAQLARTARDHYWAYLATVGATVAPLMLATEYYNRWDPARAEAYDDVPQELKDGGIVIMTPWVGRDDRGERPNYIWLPVGSMAAPVVQASRLAMQRLPGLEDAADRVGTSKDAGMGERFLQAAQMAFTLFSPIKGEDPAAIGATFLPPLAKQALEIGMNKSTYGGRQIAGDSSDARASAFGQGVAGGLNAAGAALGSDFMQNIRPSHIDYLARQLPAYGDTILGASKDIAPSGAESGEDRPIQNAPAFGQIAGRVIRDTGGANLERLENEGIPDSVKAIMQQAGMRPADFDASVGATYKGATLTRAEQLRWQRAYNARMGGIPSAARDTAKWRAGDKEGAVKEAVAKARDDAATAARLPTPAEMQERAKRQERARAR